MAAQSKHRERPTKGKRVPGPASAISKKKKSPDRSKSSGRKSSASAHKNRSASGSPAAHKDAKARKRSASASSEQGKRSAAASPSQYGKKRKVDGEGSSKSADGRGTKKKPFKGSKPSKPLDHKAQKALSEERKRKRKPNYELQKDVVAAWEKMRQRKLSNEERKSIISQTLAKLKGKYLEMARLKTVSRVLQTCWKHCRQEEREELFQELKPHLFTLAEDAYGCHLALKILDHAKKDQLSEFLAALHGKVVQLCRHPSGSTVLERAYQLANGAQKREMVSEFFSPEFRLFRNVSGGKCRVSDVLLTEPSKRKTIFEHMTLALQPILDKGIVDHSIIHRALLEYISICNQGTIRSLVEQLGGPSLVRMVHTSDGARIGILCLRSGTPKERKKIVKGMKGHVSKVAQDDHGYAVLLSIMDVVDDTELVSKIIMAELAKSMRDICLNKYARRLVLYLLAPNVPRYFPEDLRRMLACPIELRAKSTDEESVKPPGTTAENRQDDKEVAMDGDDDLQSIGVSKKDPAVRRTELLSKGDFAKKLTEACAAHAGELLRSALGTDVIFEVAAGGMDGIMLKVASEGVQSVHKAIADLAALPKEHGDGAGEHVMEQYHASRTIRRLLLDSRCHNLESFGGVLWRTALEGRLETWAQGHSSKVVAAVRDSQDPGVQRAAKSEIRSLVSRGLLEPAKPEGQQRLPAQRKHG